MDFKVLLFTVHKQFASLSEICPTYCITWGVQQEKAYRSMDFMPSDDEVITRNINKIWGVILPYLLWIYSELPCVHKNIAVAMVIGGSNNGQIITVYRYNDWAHYCTVQRFKNLSKTRALYHCDVCACVCGRARVCRWGQRTADALTLQSESTRFNASRRISYPNCSQYAAMDVRRVFF